LVNGETIGKAVVLLFVLFFASIIGLVGCVNIIDDGEVGVRKTLGDYNDYELGTGIALSVPFISDVYTVNTKIMKIDEDLEVPSSEGLSILMHINVIYSVRPERASDIYQTVSDDIEGTLLTPYVRNGMRDVVTGYTSEAVYTEVKRGEIAGKVKVYLQEKLGKDLIIHEVLIREVQLPDMVREAIDTKISAKQLQERKNFEVEIAKKDAEIEIAKATGTAEANKIIANSITPEYLKWKFINSLDASQASIIYVPTEANLPVLESTRLLNMPAK